MKNSVIALFLCLILAAITPPAMCDSASRNFATMYAEDVFFFAELDGQFYEVDTFNKSFRNLSKQVSTNGNGFTELNYTATKTSPVTLKTGKYLLIGGSNFLFYLADRDRMTEQHNSNEESFINAVSANNFVVENGKAGKVAYSPENLRKRFFSTDQEFRYELLPSGAPWAIHLKEGEKPTLKLSFHSPVKGITILGGFVDLTRPTLFNLNSRPKIVKVRDLDSKDEFVVNLLDGVRFQDIVFPFESGNIELSFLDSFPGTKYSDLCVSAILPHFNQQMRKIARVYGEVNPLVQTGQFLQSFKELK